MADNEFIPAGMQEGLKSGIDGFVIAIIVMIVLGIIGFTIWYFWFKKQFKHNITLRIKTKGNTDIIYFDKYRYVKSKGEPESIQLWKTKQFKPLPPEDAKDFDTTGKEYVEGWLVDTGEIRFISTEINDVIYLTQENKPKGEIIVDNLDLDDKEFYSNQFFEAQRFKNQGLLGWIKDNAAIIALLMIGLLIVVFWNDMAKTTSQVSASNAEISKDNALLIARLESLLHDKEYIDYLNSTGVIKGYNMDNKNPAPN